MSAQRLKNQPDPASISTILDESKGNVSLELSSALVNFTVPETYDILDRSIQIKICKALAHIRGLGLLITQLERRLQEESPNLGFLGFCNAIGDLFCEELAVDWANMSGSNAEIQQLNGFIYGGRLFSSVTFAYDHYRRSISSLSRTTEPEEMKWLWLTDVSSYGKWIGQMILQNKSSRALEKAMKLGPAIVDAMSEVLLGIELSSTLQAYKGLRITQQWFFIQHVLLPWFERKRVSSASATAPTKVVEPFILGHEKDLYNYLEEHVPSKLNQNSSQLQHYVTLVTLSKPTTEMVRALIEKWGNENTVKHVPVNVQGSMTRLLLLTLNVLDSNQIALLASSPAFLNGISNRLAAISSRVRVFGTVFAEEMTKKTPKPLNFNLEIDLAEQEELRSLANPASTSGNDITEPSSDEENEEPNLGSSENLEHRRPVAFTPYALPEDDNEDSDDDPTLVQRQRILPPVYIKDLISYLSSDDNYEKQRLALEHGAALIERKRNYGREVIHYASKLASVVASLQNSFEMKDFDDLKLSILTEVAKCEESAKYLTVVTFSGDYSLHQRLMILSALALSTVRHDQMTTTKTDNPTNTLPGKVGLLFQNETKEVALIDSLASQIQTVSLKETKEKVEDHEQISGPKVLRISQRLLKEQSKTGAEGKITRAVEEATIVGETIFFALLGQWYSNGSVSIGNYSELFVSHYLKTLAIIMSRSRRVQIPDMTSELLDLLLGIRNLAASEPKINEGLLTALALIIQSNEPEFLVTHWPNQVVEFQNWLEDSWKDINDETVQQTAAAVLYQLVEITDKWKMRLIGASIDI